MNCEVFISGIQECPNIPYWGTEQFWCSLYHYRLKKCHHVTPPYLPCYQYNKVLSQSNGNVNKWY